MVALRLRLGGVAGVVVLGVWVFTGCGGDDAVLPDSPEAEAEAATAPDAEPERAVLELPDAEHQTIQVRRGQRARLHDRPRGKVLETVRDETDWGSPTVFAVARQRGPWVAVHTAYFEDGRLAWVRLDPTRLRAGSVDVEIEVDLSDFRAKLIEDGKVTRSFTVSIGNPEAPTPTGRFAVTDTFRGDLHPAYGCCAVALTARQTRLPSGWLGGDRIAIHGTYAPLGAASSQGCVRAADEDVNELIETVPPGTPVTIRQ